jgi:ribosome-associated translation inhibitor RaiA
MRIEVSGSPAVYVERMRTYVEYRVFSQLAAFARQVETVRVVINRRTDNGPTSCVMSAELIRGGRIHTRSRDTQPLRAVDSAARKLGEATSTKLQGL